MIRIGGNLGYHILRRWFPGEIGQSDARSSHLLNYKARLVDVVGNQHWELLKTKTIVDFGCGHGEGSIELALDGAVSVIGIDIRESVLEHARLRAVEAGVANRCRFVSTLSRASADVVVSIDAFEHFKDPRLVLKSMSDLLVPGGAAILSFGPTWYHPRGGHLFSPFPWAHLMFSESALCRWRRDFRDDGAMRFCEVDGGLNQMTIAKFEEIAKQSSLEIEHMVTRPIRALRRLHCHVTREFLTSVVDCVLTKLCD
ncbi:methyltransferase domain-containing protein [Stieleria sp. ICT_E10.1]|uniref:class I SAM-dependent methyltransferase n=1 Tax=Stieleria sedimenti TaxID=2976331 RepID=UPI0021805EA4|nr:methyltransferase domain-containing protein [Stieleria sedimenti]MCS7466753.1 methyltransferase domain-containing protein [Stieleria sedimenti]